MGNETVLTNLRKESDVYGLQNLVSRIDLETRQCSDQKLQGARFLLTIVMSCDH